MGHVDPETSDLHHYRYDDNSAKTMKIKLFLFGGVNNNAYLYSVELKQLDMKKGILIDVVNETITEVEVGDYKDIQKKLGVSLFDVVSVDENNDVYVDDEGLLSVDKDSKFFGFKGFDVKLGGNGLVLGINHNNGESKNTTLTVEFLKERIEFFTFAQARPYLVKIGMY